MKRRDGPTVQVPLFGALVSVVRRSVSSGGFESEPLGSRDRLARIDALTGPSGRSPLGETTAADALYYGPVGRLIDAWTWFGVLGQRTTAHEGALASVFIQPSATALPLAMVGLFANARRIVAEAERDPEIRAGADRVVTRWRAWASD